MKKIKYFEDIGKYGVRTNDTVGISKIIFAEDMPSDLLYAVMGLGNRLEMAGYSYSVEFMKSEVGWVMFTDDYGYYVLRDVDGYYVASNIFGRDENLLSSIIEGVREGLAVVEEVCPEAVFVCVNPGECFCPWGRSYASCHIAVGIGCVNRLGVRFSCCDFIREYAGIHALNSNSHLYNRLALYGIMYYHSSEYRNARAEILRNLRLVSGSGEETLSERVSFTEFSPNVYTVAYIMGTDVSSFRKDWEKVITRNSIGVPELLNLWSWKLSFSIGNLTVLPGSFYIE